MDHRTTKGHTTMKQALCATGVENPDLWFTNNPISVSIAIGICKKCPVIDKCRELSWSEQYGVWGGVLREQPLKHRGRPKKAKES